VYFEDAIVGSKFLIFKSLKIEFDILTNFKFPLNNVEISILYCYIYIFCGIKYIYFIHMNLKIFYI